MAIHEQANRKTCLHLGSGRGGASELTTIVCKSVAMHSVIVCRLSCRSQMERKTSEEQEVQEHPTGWCRSNKVPGRCSF